MGALVSLKKKSKSTPPVEKVKENQSVVTENPLLAIALEYVSNKFNLDKGYQITKFSDGKNNFTITVSNGIFTQTIKFESKAILEAIQEDDIDFIEQFEFNLKALGGNH